MKKFILFSFCFFWPVSIFCNDQKLLHNYLFNLTKIIFIVRSDKKYSEYNKNRTYDYVIETLKSKDLTDPINKAQLLVALDINKKLTSLIKKTDYSKDYKRQASSILNIGYYDKKLAESFDESLINSFKDYLDNVISKEIFNHFDLIKLTFGFFLAPQYWYYNEETYQDFNDYLNSVYIFGIFLLFKKEPSKFLTEEEMKAQDPQIINELFIERKKDFLNKLKLKIKELEIPKKITSNLLNEVKKNLEILEYLDILPDIFFDAPEDLKPDKDSLLILKPSLANFTNNLASLYHQYKD